MNIKKTVIAILIMIAIAITISLKLPSKNNNITLPETESTTEKTVEEKLLEKPGKTVLYFSPHQDDEAITLGIDIAVSVKNGYDVHVILCTDGSKSKVREILNNNIHCNFCGSDHNYELSPDEFIHARDLEFFDSCLALGVKESNIHIEEKRMTDASASVEGAKEIIKKYLNLFGEDCTVCTVYPNDSNAQHNDHRDLGLAATELKAEGLIKNMYLFEEPYLATIVAHKEGTEPNKYHAPDDIMKLLQNSLDEYEKWEPENKRFAIGYHSVGKYIEQVRQDKTLYYHIY